jgi:hypothetical protein
MQQQIKVDAGQEESCLFEIENSFWFILFGGIKIYIFHCQHLKKKILILRKRERKSANC